MPDLIVINPRGAVGRWDVNLLATLSKGNLEYHFVRRGNRWEIDFTDYSTGARSIHSSHVRLSEALEVFEGLEKSLTKRAKWYSVNPMFLQSLTRQKPNIGTGDWPGEPERHRTASDKGNKVWDYREQRDVPHGSHSHALPNYIRTKKGKVQTRPKKLFLSGTSDLSPSLKKANTLFRKFHEGARPKMNKMRLGDMKALIHLGDIVEIRYRPTEQSKIKGSIYRHVFKSRPALMTTADGKTLVVHGGKLATKENGIHG